MKVVTGAKKNVKVAKIYNMSLKQFITPDSFVRKARVMSFGNYEKCESLFIEAFELTDLTIKDGEFKMLPEYKEVIQWLSNSEGKGILLTGSNGRGKTAILKGVLPLIFKSRGYILRVLNSGEIDYKTFQSYLDSKVFIGIDEMGKDSIINDYGTKSDPVEAAIDHCEDRIKMLLMSSTLPAEQIQKRYGNRTLDRIKRLCKVVVFKGESFRK